ncbi:MAG: hypothetical protein ETSY2_39450 [Candidatus Entotheonella gemina]|uniref:ChrR-like cupin domain-containing protein n=1 Tax=Candidatus Entotheonella gemina TaxID=1429439 RepID=W4LQJ5_9BACT|nr:MAG: hypothetical protein ETSY2_39450 [Candidatus Entotheonella gemina]
MASPPQPEEPQDTMALYALGALDAEESKSITERLQAGDEASAGELQQAENLIALMGHLAPAVSPPASLKDRLMVRIQNELPPPPSPSAIRAGLDLESLDWVPSDWPGVNVHWLRQDEATGSGAVYFHIQPGYSAPSHRHIGAEDCLVMQGGFRDRRGEYHPGDLVYYEPGSVHEDFQALDGEPCVLFVVYQQGGIEVI